MYDGLQHTTNEYLLIFSVVSRKTSLTKSEEKCITQPSGKVFIDDMRDLAPEDAYRFDRKPDASNLTYQSIYNKHIARYHRVINSVLGLRANQIINLGKEKQKRHKDGFRYYGKENIRKQRSDEEIVIDMSDIGQTADNKFSVRSVNTEHYISLESQDEQCKNSAQVNSQSQTQGAKKESADVNPAVKYKDTDYQKIQRQTAAFNRHLYDNPHDVDEWIKFVKFQEEAMLIKDKDTSHSEKRGRINQVMLDIKLSILEKALEKNPASIELKKEQLLLGAEIWESSKLAKVWRCIIVISTMAIYNKCSHMLE